MTFIVTEGRRPLSIVEQHTGQRAPFHVFYTHVGSPAWDAIWADTPEEAAEKLVAFCKELGMTGVVVTRVHRVTPDS
jgi:hypothetical protein